MTKIRVLVVDDAVVFRRLVADELAQDHAIDVVGTAANGRIALTKLAQLNPDVIILDVEMPVMDGLAMLTELRKTPRRPIVIMFSSMTERGASATLDALALGASDYFTKPTSSGGMEESLQIIREQLIPKIKALYSSAMSRQLAMRLTPLPKPRAVATAPARSLASKSIQMIAIGSSTGGPNALLSLFSQLPADLPVPIVIVQHMPPMFTRLLAERLTAQSPIVVQEGSSGVILQPGQAWIAPGDHHMMVLRDGLQSRLLVHQDPPENSCRPSVDVLLRSVAKAYGNQCLTVILTGMGQDGLRGCEAIKQSGGQILVQDEATSVVWGMPGFVAKAGLADKILPLGSIADEIGQRLQIAKVAR